MLNALGELHVTQGDRLCWVLGVDMAHMGRRYGDPTSVQANDGIAQEIEARDRERMSHVVAGDADAFWAAVHSDGADALKWCGSAPLYAFMKAQPEAKARVLDYSQWNIDDSSIVSFGALSFHPSGS